MDITKPRAVVFDLGKVLLDFDYAIAARNIAARSNSPVARVLDVIDQSSLLIRYESGLLSTAEFYDRVSAETGFRGDLAEFSGLFGDIFFPIEPMLHLQSRLAAHGIPTFIFSNTNELAVRHIRENFAFFHNFTAHILSFEHGAMKPDSKLYEVVETKTRCEKPEIVYLDDRLENIEAGRTRGWQVVHHQSAEQSIAAIQRLRLLPD